MPEKHLPWLFNEFAHPGVDHADPDYPAHYEEKMLKFRDFEQETKGIVDLLGISSEEIVIDLGAGTGAFAVPGARFCRKMIAVDTAQAMLDFTAGKARRAGLANIEFVHAGFLTYRHSGEPVDVAVTRMALHHLPDFWKMVALGNIHAFLKPGGRLLLSDVIFSFPVTDHAHELQAMVDGMGTMAGQRFADEAATHCREEFSTFDWILEEMLKRGGFTVTKKNVASPTRIDYVCVKGG